MDLKFYRLDRVPRATMAVFERAVRKVSTASKRRGEGVLSHASAFGAIVRASDLDARIALGQLRSVRGKRAVVTRGLQIPAGVKDRLVETADRLGIKVGAAGRLLLIGQAGSLSEMVDAIEAGIDAERGVPLAPSGGAA